MLFFPQPLDNFCMIDQDKHFSTKDLSQSKELANADEYEKSF